MTVIIDNKSFVELRKFLIYIRELLNGKKSYYCMIDRIIELC